MGCLWYGPVTVTPGSGDEDPKRAADTAELRVNGPSVGRMLILAAADNVGVVVDVVPTGGLLRASSGQCVELRDDIPRGHKVALEHLPRGAAVRKYGEIIGLTTSEVREGQHVHVHNTESQRLRGDLAGKTPAHLGANDGE